MPLTVDITRKPNGICVVKLYGRLDTTTYGRLESQLDPLLQASTKALIFDMAELSYISSMGLRTILAARKAIEGHGNTLVITNLQPQIAKVFEIAKALPNERVFSSVEEADRYLTAMQERERA